MSQFDSTKISYRQSSRWHLFAEKIPLFLLASASSVITFIAQRSSGAVVQDNLPFSLRTANAVVSYAGYIIKLVYPSHLAVFYPFNKPMLWQVIVSYTILAGISLCVICAPKRRYLTIGWLWYLGTLVPVIGLVQVGLQAMADRYTYLPSIGIFIMAAWGVPEVLAKWHYKNILLGIMSGLIVGVLLFCTRIQVRYWQDTFTLYEHTLAVTGDNFVMQRHYGITLARQGRFDEALEHLNESKRINPRYLDVWNIIGKVFLAQGEIEKAVTYFNDILRLKPDYPDAHINLGLALAAQAKYNEAIEHFTQAIKAKPHLSDVNYYLGLAYNRLGKYDLAIQNYKEAIRLKPDWFEPMNSLAWTLAAAEDSNFRNPAEAVNYAQRACELTKFKQSYLLDTLAVAYASAGKFPQAIEVAEKAIDLAEAAGQKDLAQEIQNRLQLYKQNQSYIGSFPKIPRPIDLK